MTMRGAMPLVRVGGRMAAGAAILLCGLCVAIAEEKREDASPAAMTGTQAPAPTMPAAREEAPAAKGAAATQDNARPGAPPPDGSASRPNDAIPPQETAQPTKPTTNETGGAASTTTTPRGEIAPTIAVAPVPKACADAQAALDAARAAQKLSDGVAALEKMKAADSGCKPEALYCAGRALALAHVEAAYTAVEKGNLASAEQFLVRGRRFGDPWQLLIGVGDAAIQRAHKRHERKDWAEASAAYQSALLAFGTPTLCAGEAPPPEPAALEPLFERMGTAMLLADTPNFVRMKCGGPCEMPFLGPVAGFRPSSQTLPITFEAKSATLTPNGIKVVKALAVCMDAQRATRVMLAARTNATPASKTLASARLETIRRVFTEGGAKAELMTTAEEDAQSASPDQGKSFLPAEQNALSERIELRDVTADGRPGC